MAPLNGDGQFAGIDLAEWGEERNVVPVNVDYALHKFLG